MLIPSQVSKYPVVPRVHPSPRTTPAHCKTPNSQAKFQVIIACTQCQYTRTRSSILDAHVASVPSVKNIVVPCVRFHNTVTAQHPHRQSKRLFFKMQHEAASSMKRMARAERRRRKTKNCWAWPVSKNEPVPSFDAVPKLEAVPRWEKGKRKRRGNSPRKQDISMNRFVTCLFRFRFRQQPAQGHNHPPS